jgi:hypothetical protein
MSVALILTMRLEVPGENDLLVGDWLLTRLGGKPPVLGLFPNSLLLLLMGDGPLLPLRGEPLLGLAGDPINETWVSDLLITTDLGELGTGDWVLKRTGLTARLVLDVGLQGSLKLILLAGLFSLTGSIIAAIGK